MGFELEARKTADPTMSSGLPARPSGVCSMTLSVKRGRGRGGVEAGSKKISN
jgi:hypothetical protein